jgi:hypothetical protein
MMTRAITGLILLSLLAAAAPAREMGSDEKKWVKACLDALGAENDDVRSGAELCLARLGTDALPLVLDGLGKIRKPLEREALVRAVSGMGRRKAILRLRQMKLADARKYGKKADTLLEWLEADDQRAPSGPDEGRSPPEIAAKVREILGDMRDGETFSTSGKHVRQLVELGRDAVPELVAVIREGRSDGFGGFAASFIPDAASHALKELVTDDDLPLLAALLAEGHVEVACCFGKIRAEGALNALLEPIRRGFVGIELMEALGRFRKEKAVADTVIAYLKKHGDSNSADIAIEFVADAGMMEAAPVIAEMVRPANPWDRRVELAACLARLGDDAGITQLLEVFANRDKEKYSGADYARHRAGEALNWVVGRKIYVGRFDGEDGPKGNDDEALKAFREWWVNVRDHVLYNPQTRRWEVQ